MLQPPDTTAPSVPSLTPGFGNLVPFSDVARRERPRRLLIVGLALLLATALGAGSAWHPVATSAARDSVTILGASADSLDPAVQWDTGSAQVVSQLFDSLTAVDSAQNVQPALAGSWETQNGGKRIVFHLRSGLEFSDGSALTADSVVNSWMRVLAPAKPSPLAPLLDGVVGARAYREGAGPKSAVGIHAVGTGDVQVDLSIPSAEFPAIVSSPSLAVVPPKIDSDPGILEPGTFVGSGGYVLSALTATETTMVANSHYWAGKPAIKTVHLVSTAGADGTIASFEAGSLDYASVYGQDATWIQYDKRLGPSLRADPSPSVEYYGFNTTKAPFNDVHVRLAFEYGIDWRRLVILEAVPGMVPATGMVPTGVPGHSATDFGAVFDLARAKSELAQAGFPNGTGFPKVTLVTTGSDGQTLEAAIIRQLHDNLGIDLSFRQVDGSTYNDQLATDAPAMWQMGWVADYPGANDFLGILLGSGQPNNFGKWSSASFDAALTKALSATDAASMQAGFDAAQAVVRDEAPVIPVDYGVGYSLAAKGLLGALPNSQGIIRYAGLAWAA
ncbi:MAG TPA: peptide ABC transporter substrate-binding protein [Candidatus Limnocylindrales bacterium]